MPTQLIPLDFHCHSTHSDGSYSIKDLIDLAKSNGNKYLALTDHDTVDGISEAKEYASHQKLNFISGVEVSVTWENNHLIHILGLGIDETNANLIENLNNLRSQRLERGKKIAYNLSKIGISNALEGALKYCNNINSLSRTHFSQFLIDNGFAKPGKAFTKYLAPGKPGYVAQKWANLKDAVNWIINSGGIAVIAHPCRYKFTRTKLLRLIQEFKAYGGSGIEVISSSHTKDDAYSIATIANQEGLLSSIGSDFHNTKYNYPKITLGINPSLPLLNCKPIYNEFGITDNDLL